MDFNSIALVTVALIPAIALFIYIYKKDRAEKEPLWLLLILFLAGVIITEPAGWLEGLIDYPINAMFSGLTEEINGEYYLDTVPFYIYTIIENFIGVALIEEGLKFLALFLITRKSKNFNSLFDGMIYAVVVSLGFAAFENILYAFSFGWETVLMRAFTAVPGHMFDGVLMGYFYSFWNVFRLVEQLENICVKGKFMPAPAKPVKKNRQLVLALLVPVTAHGFYDFCLSADSDFLYYFFYIFLIALYIYCFYRVNKLSKSDLPYGLLLHVVLFKRNPKLMENAAAMLANEAIVSRLDSKTVETLRNALLSYPILTHDDDPDKETALEELLEEATE